MVTFLKSSEHGIKTIEKIARTNISTNFNNNNNNNNNNNAEMLSSSAGQRILKSDSLIVISTYFSFQNKFSHTHKHHPVTKRINLIKINLTLKQTQNKTKIIILIT